MWICKRKWGIAVQREGRVLRRCSRVVKGSVFVRQAGGFATNHRGRYVGTFSEIGCIVVRVIGLALWGYLAKKVVARVLRDNISAVRSVRIYRKIRSIVVRVGEDVPGIDRCAWEERVVVPMVGGFAWKATKCCVSMCNRTNCIVVRVGGSVRRGRLAKRAVVFVHRGRCLVETSVLLRVAEAAEAAL